MSNSNEGLQLLEYNLAPSVRAFTTTRKGGVSTDAYASFNITHYCGDNALNVLENRKILCNHLGINNDALILPHQTHSTNVINIDHDFLNLTADEKQSALYNIDALITNVKGVCIGVSTADCVPVLLYDPQEQCVAAIHAGWRGVVGDIVGQTIKRMSRQYSNDAGQLCAIIGPSISQQSFEVGEEVYDAFVQAGFDMQNIAMRASQLKRPLASGDVDKWHIDLWAAITLQLLEAGVQLENINISNICTYQEHDLYFSARRNGINSGRLFTGIMLMQDV
jgi:YfiH family protein